MYAPFKFGSEYNFLEFRRSKKSKKGEKGRKTIDKNVKEMLKAKIPRNVFVCVILNVLD